MRKAKIIFFFILSFVIMYGVIGLLLPSTYLNRQSILIEDDSRQLLNYLSDMNNFNQWNPWYGADSTIKYHLGKNKSENDIIYFNSELGDIGSGWAKVIKQTENSLELELNLGRQGTSKIIFSIYLTDENYTRLSIEYYSEFGFNILKRWENAFNFTFLPKDIRKGLEKIKLRYKKNKKNNLKNSEKMLDINFIAHGVKTFSISNVFNFESIFEHICKFANS